MSGAQTAELELVVVDSGSGENQVLALAEGLPERACFECERKYQPVRYDQRWCSRVCKKLTERKMWKRARDAQRSGIAAAAYPRKEVLQLARDIAKRVALSRLTRTCSADDVYEELAIRGLVEQLGPAAGAIFKTKDWHFDRFIESKRLTNNGRIIRRWRYVGNGSA